MRQGVLFLSFLVLHKLIPYLKLLHAPVLYFYQSIQGEACLGLLISLRGTLYIVQCKVQADKHISVGMIGGKEGKLDGWMEIRVNEQ